MIYRHTGRSTAGMIFCLLALLASEIALAAEPKRVMVLHSFGRDFKPWNEYARTIRTELERQSPWPLEITDHSLLTARSSDEQPETPFVEYLRALHAKKPLDLIVSIGAPAAAFVQRHRADLFANTPMVFTAVDERRVQSSLLTPSDAVVAVRIDYLEAMKNILQVLPNTRNIVVVVGMSPIEKFWKEEIGSSVASLSDRVTFGWTDGLSFDEILKRAAALPPNTAIFWELMIVDAAGVVHEGNTALAQLHAVANAPIFSYDESFFAGQIVGGPMLSVEEGSRQAAGVAIRILGGEKAGDIKVPPVRFTAPRFDWRQMQRWGISESRLPPGSEIYFRDPGLWDQYRLPILAILGTILVQGGMIGWLVYEHRRRSAAEVRSRSAMAELANMNRLATAGQLSASIAHEINQPVTGMVLKASAALRWLAVEKPDMDKIRSMLTDIVGAGQRAGEIITSVRAMFKKEENAKAAINLNNLINTVLALLRVDLQNDGVSVETQLDEALPATMGDAVQLQQVILNLIVNAADAMRPVQPRVLKIQTSRSASGMVHTSIEDTGTGISAPDRERIFDPLFTTKAAGMGMGLSICRSIVENHGGRIWVSPGANRGSIFQFELPTKSNNASMESMAA
jgi:signal transduction histidine kinase